MIRNKTHFRDGRCICAQCKDHAQRAYDEWRGDFEYKIVWPSSDNSKYPTVWTTPYEEESDA